MAKERYTQVALQTSNARKASAGAPMLQQASGFYSWAVHAGRMSAQQCAEDARGFSDGNCSFGKVCVLEKKKEGVLKDKNHTRTTMEQQCASCSTRDMQLGAYLVTYMKDGTYSTVQKGEHVLFTN